MFYESEKTFFVLFTRIESLKSYEINEQILNEYLEN